ncbi:GMC family oxidoreductase N-terminal domain-containing protein, partial [Pseudomonas aeruginosa]|uniref:GMC family oxidoreductase N-terminal domain-containing protein n=1 Tax=Pseudomonas aeruginosa TaxID=287 RepID=UPI001C896C1A
MTMTFQHDDLPLALYSAAQVRDLDARLIAAGTPGFELMQRAAHARREVLLCSGAIASTQLLQRSGV